LILLLFKRKTEAVNRVALVVMVLRDSRGRRTRSSRSRVAPVPDTQSFSSRLVELLGHLESDGHSLIIDNP
jgi:hypothetical protein